MTTDPFLSEIGADWRRQTVDLDRLHSAIDRRRRLTRLALIIKAAGTGIALLCGAWFVRLALGGAPAIFALAGIVLLVSLPLMLIDLAGTARSLRLGDDDTPAGVLRRARNQAAMARHLLWGHRAAALLLGACALGLLGLYATGRARAEEAIVMVPLWALLASGGWLWQLHRARHLASEIARCDRLLAELGEADDA